MKLKVVRPVRKDTEGIGTRASFNDLMKKAEDINDMCCDYMVSSSDMSFICEDTKRYGINYLSEGEKHYSNLSRYALGQLAGKVGVPSAYLDRCIKNGELELARNNMNTWIDRYNSRFLVREYDNNVRGVLSPRYSILDNPDILDVLSDTVDLDTFKVKGSFLSEERLHLRLVSREMLNVDGEDLFAGLFIDSSDVGRSALNVSFGIYKQVCTNGLIISRAGGTLFKQKHIGITIDEFREGFSNALSNVDILNENAVEWVKRAKNGENHWSADSEYEDEIEEFVAYIRQQTNLSKDNAHKVIDLMNTKYEDTRWGLINGITEVAQDFTLEKRLELEKVAGSLLVA